MKLTSQLSGAGEPASRVRLVRLVHELKAPRCSNAGEVRADSPSFRREFECLEASASKEALPRWLELMTLKARRLFAGSSRKKAARSSSTDGPLQCYGTRVSIPVGATKVTDLPLGRTGRPGR